jgi:hypothetical protein
MRSSILNMGRPQFGILYIDNIEDFKTECNDNIKKKNYYGENIIIGIDNIYTKQIKTKTIKKLENPKDLSHYKKYRIYISLYNGNQYFLEKNGSINCIDDVLKKYDFNNFEIAIWYKILKENKDIDFNKQIDAYLTRYNNIIHTNTISDIYIKLKEKGISCTDLVIPNSTYPDTIKSFTEVNVISQDSDLKLPKYDKKTCVEHNKQSEGKYNQLICNGNPDRYILLDKIISDGIEVADVYDKNYKTFFHNKKRGDLRVLCLQVYTGAIIMKDEKQRQKYNDNLKKKGINTINGEFSYVLGIIGENKKISLKDKLSIGILSTFLKSHNINLSIDYIDVVE